MTWPSAHSISTNSMVYRKNPGSRYFCVYATLTAMLSAESGGLCLGTATRSGVMPILLRSPLHYIVWHNRNEVYVKKLYILVMVVMIAFADTLILETMIKPDSQGWPHVNTPYVLTYAIFIFFLLSLTSFL